MITPIIIQANHDFINGACTQVKYEPTTLWEEPRLYRCTQAVNCNMTLNNVKFSDN